MPRVREGQTRMEVSFGNERSGRLQWYAANRLPGLVARAARAGGYSSSAHYIRSAVISALSRDLGIDVEALNAEQPTKASNPIYADPTQYGASNSVEDVV
jgi:hypothetical protein